MQSLTQKQIDRFWGKVDKEKSTTFYLGTRCWEWTGTLSGGYYGGWGWRGKTHYVHRFSWELSNGPIPKGILVCHHCDNPRCVNPLHLFLGTNQDNQTDMVRKGRQLRGETCGWANLTQSQVDEIRRRYGEFGRGGTSGKDLAIEFGVSTATISLIVNHKRWV